MKDKDMKGLIQVTATKGKMTITAEVYGDLHQKESLLGILLNRNKILHIDRHLWKVKEIKLNKEIR